MDARTETNSGCLMINTLSEGNLDAPESNEAALPTAIALRTTIMNWRVPA